MKNSFVIYMNAFICCFVQSSAWVSEWMKRLTGISQMSHFDRKSITFARWLHRYQSSSWYDCSIERWEEAYSLTQVLDQIGLSTTIDECSSKQDEQRERELWVIWKFQVESTIVIGPQASFKMAIWQSLGVIFSQVEVGFLLFLSGKYGRLEKHYSQSSSGWMDEC